MGTSRARRTFLSYYFQPVEVDARAYAAEETERLQGLIDKELQKET